MIFAITIRVETSASEPELMSEIENELEYFLHAVGSELGTKVSLNKGAALDIEEISK